ncbi:MAG TPA: TetR/AcrR family transcriptional regulator [Pseudoneobacillus sp.]|nr:TetR/AcrR family transcriptional regulator [Pseudoneobacillus sp.]
MVRERKFSTESLFQATKQSLLEHGYEAFTFAILAERLEVSRGTLYKYYDNKEELVTDFMIFEMNLFLHEMKRIKEYKGFVAQFDFLFEEIFKDPTIPKLIEMGIQIPVENNEKVRTNKEKLDILHLDMYQHLQDFINLGRDEGILKRHLPDGLLLAMIFQTINIPNHFGVPRLEWVKSIKEIITTGMFEIDN